MIFYGAGEVAEIILNVINGGSRFNLNVLAVIDDDESKTHQSIMSRDIINNELTCNYNYDGILISSYKHHNTINDKLISLGYKDNKILHFFE